MKVVKPELVFHILDLQKDWINSPACAVEQRDGYLESVYDEDGFGWKSLRLSLRFLAEGARSAMATGMIIEASPPSRSRPVPPPDASTFSERLNKYAHGGLTHGTTTVFFDSPLLANTSVACSGLAKRSCGRRCVHFVGRFVRQLGPALITRSSHRLRPWCPHRRRR